MQRQKLFVFLLKGLFFYLLVGVLVLLPSAADASVTLVSFKAFEENEWARLEWVTATEIDNAGFFVQRSTTAGSSSDYTRIQIVNVASGESATFIPARGDSLLGATYAFYDKNLAPGNTYYYLLEAVDFNSISEFHGPITFTLSIDATATSTPTVTKTPTITPTPTITNTPTRTLTPPPTFPPLNTVTPTRTQTPTVGPSPTNTPSPTLTFTPSVTLHPLDLTLTDVLAQVTPLPTYTPRPPTRTPFPTFTSESSPTATPEETIFEGVSSSGLLGLLLAGFVVFGSGGALTLIFILSRREENQPRNQ